MDPFESLVKSTDPFSEESISICKIELVRFVQVNNNFWSHILLATFIIVKRNEFQLEVSENTVVTLSHPSSRNP
jgi:hypothetical protein